MYLIELPFSKPFFTKPYPIYRQAGTYLSEREVPGKQHDIPVRLISSRDKYALHNARFMAFVGVL